MTPILSPEAALRAAQIDAAEGEQLDVFDCIAVAEVDGYGGQVLSGDCPSVLGAQSSVPQKGQS